MKQTTPLDPTGGDGLTYAGGNTTEATSTTTAVVDLLTVTALSIAALTPFLFFGVVRKTDGAAAAVSGTLKLNTTNLGGPTNDDELFISSNANLVASGSFHCLFPSRLTNYLQGSTGAYKIIGSGVSNRAHTLTPEGTNTIPNATITDIVIQGSTASALVPCGVDQVQVYTLPTS